MTTEEMADKIEMEIYNIYRQKRFISVHQYQARPGDREIRVVDKKNKYTTKLIILPGFRDENNEKIVSIFQSEKLGQLVVAERFARPSRVPMVATKMLMELIE